MLNSQNKKCFICNNTHSIKNMLERDNIYMCDDCYNKLLVYTKKDSLINYSIEDLKKISLKQYVFTKQYKIAGTTFNNENNKDIQKELKKILKEYINEGYINKDDMYLGYSTSDIKNMDLEVSQFEDIKFNAKLKEDIFENKPCIKVYIKRADNITYTHIGYIPKRYNQIEEVSEIINNYHIKELSLYIVGGTIKKCQVEEDDEYNEHFYVETISLDYGLRLFIEYI